MSVSFDHIPAAGTLRTPLFYVEVNSAGASSPVAEVNPTLIVGNMLAAGTGTAGVLTPITGADDSVAKTLYGEGSSIAEMVKAFRANNASDELFALAFVDDVATGTESEWTVTFTGPATADGIVSLYIGGVLVSTAITDADADSDIATAVAAAVTAASDMPVTASAALGVVTLVSKHASEFSAQIDVRLNYLGLPETLPAGTTGIIAQSVVGTTNPDISTLAAILGDEPFDYIITPYVDTAALDDIETMMDDTTGRWAWNRQLFGHSWTAKRDTVGALGTLGNGRNDQHVTLMGLDPTPTNPWMVIAAAIGKASQSLNGDPALPCQTLGLTGVLPAIATARFTQGQRNTLLFDGIATTTVNVAEVQIERLITTNQVDAAGNPTDAYLDVTTLFTTMRFNRRMKNMVTSRWGRVKLADDGIIIPEGAKLVTPQIIKGGITAEYFDMTQLGWVENIDNFADGIVVVRPTGDPNRVDVLVEPDYINQVRVFALQNRFKLQAPATSI